MPCTRVIFRNRLDHKIDLTKKSRSIGNYLDATINSAWYYPFKKSSWDSSDRDRFIFWQISTCITTDREKKENRSRDRLGKISGARPFVGDEGQSQAPWNSRVRTGECDGRSCVNGVIRVSWKEGTRRKLRISRW